MSSVNRLALPPGTVLRDFEILEALGQGGFGITYRAINTALDQEVAIKEYMPGAFAIRDGKTLSVHPNGSESEDIFQWGLKRFLEEARILARLSHPNIVRVLYYMSLNETGYMVMDFLHGQTLSGWLFERGQPLTQQDILKILDPLTDALALVHDNGLAHRDIKPDNIFMRNGKTPVLIDFGAARNVFSGQSQTVAAIVTPGYSPNEQYGGGVDQGPWTDIYALGGVVYRMITGQAPTDAPSRIAHEMEERPDPCGSLLNIADTSFDADFLHAIDWALKLRPNERPQNVREWRDALGLGTSHASAPTIVGKAPDAFDWSENSPQVDETIALGAGEAPPSAVVAPSSKRNRLTHIAAASLAVLLIASAAAWWHQPQDEDRIGNSVSQAFPLGAIGNEPVQISDAIGGEDRRDIIRFDIGKDSEVSFLWKDTPPDARLRLFGKDGQQVQLLTADNEEIADLTAGDYALEISSQQGLSQPYALELRSDAVGSADRPGASPHTALDLAGRGRMNGSDVLFNGRIWLRQREHFFKFTLDKPSRVSVALEISNASGSLSFTESSGIAIATREIMDGQADPLIANLPAGEHYIAITMRGGKPWAYRLKVKTGKSSIITSSASAGIAPTGEGESYGTARLLPELTSAAQSYDIRFTGQTSERYLEIRPSEPGLLIIEADNGAFSEIEVFRGKDSVRVSRATKQDGLAVRTNVEQGQYIIKLSAETPSAKDRMTLRFAPGSVAGATADNPVRFGSLGARPIEDKGKLDAGFPEKWFSFHLDGPMRVIVELTGSDDGPLPEGATLALHDRGRNRVQSFVVREQGEILMQTASLQDGRYLLELSAPNAVSTAYKLQLFSLAELAAETRNADTGDPQVHGAATVTLNYEMSPGDGLRLAKAKARAKAVKGTEFTAEAAGPAEQTASAAKLLTALNDGIPYDENWKAQWLSKDRLTISVKSRLRKLYDGENFTTSLDKPRFMTGERIPIKLRSDQPRHIGLFAWQANGTIGRIFPLNMGQSYVMQSGERDDVTKDMGVKVASAPLPGKSASEEALIVVACDEDAAFSDLAPTFAEAAQSSLTRAISTPAFLERLAGFCPASLQVRVLDYHVENPGG